MKTRRVPTDFTETIGCLPLHRAAAVTAAVLIAATISNNFLFRVLSMIFDSLPLSAEVDSLPVFGPNPIIISSFPFYIFVILVVSPRVLFNLRGWAEGALFGAAYGFFALFMVRLAYEIGEKNWTAVCYLAPLSLMFFVAAGRVDRLLSSLRESRYSRWSVFLIAVGCILGVIPIVLKNYIYINDH